MTVESSGQSPENPATPADRAREDFSSFLKAAEDLGLDTTKIAQGRSLNGLEDALNAYTGLMMVKTFNIQGATDESTRKEFQEVLQVDIELGQLSPEITHRIRELEESTIQTPTPDSVTIEKLIAEFRRRKDEILAEARTRPDIDEALKYYSDHFEAIDQKRSEIPKSEE